jgi:hypothetical protein
MTARVACASIRVNAMVQRITLEHAGQMKRREITNRPPIIYLEFQ